MSFAQSIILDESILPLHIPLWPVPREEPMSRSRTQKGLLSPSVVLERWII